MAQSDTTTALAVAINANVPVLLWGPPGQGKTSVINQIAESYGLTLETVIASIRDPSDFAGLPVIDPVTKTVTLAHPKWAANLQAAESEKPGSAVQFFDEISTAPGAVQAALLRPILDKTVGDCFMGFGVRTVAAANPADIAAGGYDLAPPISNRFVHLDWELTAQQVREGFTTGWPTVDIPTTDPEAVAGRVNYIKGIVGAFLATRSDLLTVMPKDSSDANKGFPTPRSWENAAMLHAYALEAGVNETVIALLIKGVVGESAGIEYISYYDNLDLPDPEAILADPTKYVAPREREDKVYAVAGAVYNAAMQPHPNRKGRLTQALSFFGHLASTHSDISYVYARTMMQWARAEKQKGNGQGDPDAGFEIPSDILKKFADLFSRMGIDK